MSDARLPKYVCGSKCNWYKTRRKEAGFDRVNLPEKDTIEEIVKTVMADP